MRKTLTLAGSQTIKGHIPAGLKTVDMQQQGRVYKEGVRVHRPAPPRPDENRFIVKNKGDLQALKGWLVSKKFNTFVESKDGKGQQIFGLLWDYHLGMEPSPSRKERGLVLIKQSYLVQPVALAILNAMAIESEYGKIWQSQKVNLWKYGKDSFTNPPKVKHAKR